MFFVLVEQRTCDPLVLAMMISERSSRGYTSCEEQIPVLQASLREELRDRVVVYERIVVRDYSNN